MNNNQKNKTSDERITKNYSKAVIIILSLVLVIAFVALFALNQGKDKKLPMTGVNLSDLQPDEIVSYILQSADTNDDSVTVSGNDFQVQVSGNFNWTEPSAIPISVAKNEVRHNAYSACQLNVLAYEGNFNLAQVKSQIPTQNQYDLKDYLEALKYLPQDYIYNLVDSDPDMYVIKIGDGGVTGDNHLKVFYNEKGLANISLWNIRLDIQPMYMDNNGEGYHTYDSKVIHLFYTDYVESPSIVRAPKGWSGNIDGKPMTLDDIRELAAKGDELLFEDLRKYMGGNVSSDWNSYIMVYVVEGGYRLIVHSKETGKPSYISLESIWESGGSGIDIRYNDVDEFLRATPSHPAITETEALELAEAFTGTELKPVDWYILSDSLTASAPKGIFAQNLRDSFNEIPESCHQFQDISATRSYIAVSIMTGAIYSGTADAEGYVADWEKQED